MLLPGDPLHSIVHSINEYVFYWYFYQVTLRTALCIVLITLRGVQGTPLSGGSWRSSDTLNAHCLG